MPAPSRRTLARPAAFSGTGIHSGAACSLAVHPDVSGAGILLEKAGTGLPPLPARLEFADAAQSDRRTVMIGPAGQRFEQVEHLLAALAACGIADARVVFEGPEPPFMDGGAREFTAGLLAAGLAPAGGAAPEPLVITRPTAFHDPEGNVWCAAMPHDGLRLSCFVEFPGTVVGSMGTTFEGDAGAFLRDIAPARTFARRVDLEMLQKAGLIKGGSLDVALVFDESGYLNDAAPETARRFPDEVARHKVIDLLGDLALLARPLRGHFWAWRAGHRSHLRFAAHLLHEVEAHE